MNKRVESLKKDNTSNNKKRKNKPLSKLKIDYTGDKGKAIEKIYKFYGSQIENIETSNIEQLKDIFNFNYFNIEIEFAEEPISKGICKQLRIERDAKCLKFTISSIYDIENSFEIYSVLGEKISIKKTEHCKYFSINPKAYWEYYKILDFNYLLGYLTMIDTSFDYYFERNTYYSYYNKNYEFKDAIEILNLDNYRQFNMNYHRPRSEKQKIAESYNAITYMICDSNMVLAYEDNRLQLMDKYNSAQKSDYAKSYETKKNIPKQILKLMSSNEFLKDFTFVEADELTDIARFRNIEEEYKTLRKTFNFNKLFKEKSELRFRRLGKIRALGAYYPEANCVCIDIKAPSSFMHEIGHLIDYTTDKDINLSLKKNFTHIGVQYSRAFIEEIELLDKDDSVRNYLKRKIDYFTTPTEIFARCFEIYLLEKGYTSSFSKASKDDLTLNSGYPKLSKTLINEIVKYFDSFITINNTIEDEYDPEEAISFEINNKSNNNFDIKEVENYLFSDFKSIQMSFF